MKSTVITVRAKVDFKENLKILCEKRDIQMSKLIKNLLISEMKKEGIIN